MKIKKDAIKLLELIRKQKGEYSALNKKIVRVMGPDFPTCVEPIDSDIEGALIDFLDEFLEDEIASYYLYERPGNKGGLIKEDGVTYPINGIADVKRYVFRKKEEPDYVHEFIQQVLDKTKPRTPKHPTIEGFGYPGKGYNITFHKSGTINITFDKGKFK